MNVKDYLNQVAYIKEVDFSLEDKPDPDFISDCYFSKFDDSYIIHVGREDNIKFLADHNITEQLTHGVGFSPTENKWYGWSHRAIYGFEIGSTCNKGDAHWTPERKSWTAKTMNDAKQMAIDFNEGVS